MCNVCCAEHALEETRKGRNAVFYWKNKEQNGHEGRIDVRAKGTSAEFTPAEFSLRKPGEEWSPWLSTDDLAGVLGRIGVDVKWEFVPESVKDWIHGEGAWDRMAELFSHQAPEGEGEIKRLRASVTKKRKEAILKKINKITEFLGCGPWKISGKKAKSATVEIKLEDPYQNASVKKTWIEVKKPFRIIGTTEEIKRILVSMQDQVQALPHPAQVPSCGTP